MLSSIILADINRSPMDGLLQRKRRPLVCQRKQTTVAFQCVSVYMLASVPLAVHCWTVCARFCVGAVHSATHAPPSPLVLSD